MRIHNLHLINFKNWGDSSFQFSSKLNCFVGPNGSGKTNVLDALHYLSTTKSYLNAIDAQNIEHSADFMMIEAAVEVHEQQHKLYCGLKRGQKKIVKKNKKEYERLADHIGQFPCVIISPYDRDLIIEGSETRRKFMDGVISQSDPVYLDHLLRYNKALAQRNALLKYFAANRTFDKSSLEAFDFQLEQHGSYLHEQRALFTEQLLEKLLKYYKWLAGENEQASLSYKSQLHEGGLAALLQENLNRDKQNQYTGVGTHKDDLVFMLGDKPMKKFGSQGQQKSFLIALKLAQYEFIRDKQNIKPLLLLDDIFDKLDESRVHQLISLVGEDSFGQIFITDTHKERVEQMLKEITLESKIFNVKQGQLHEES